MDKLGANAANSCPLTPLGFLERAATVFRDCPSIVYHDTVFTWSQTFRRCLRLASALVSLGICCRDVVSVLLPNVPAMYEAHFGVPMSGAVLNTINTRLDARTVSVLLRHSGSRLVLVDPASLPLLRDALVLLPPDHEPPRVIPVEDPTFPAAPAGTLTYERPLEEAGDPGFAWVRPASEWDPMVLNYTSGTTSAPKGVVHCHRAIFLVTLDTLVGQAPRVRPRQAQGEAGRAHAGHGRGGRCGRQHRPRRAPRWRYHGRGRDPRRVRHARLPQQRGGYGGQRYAAATGGSTRATSG